MAAAAVARSTPSISNRILPGRITATHCSGAPLPFPIRVSAGFLVIGLSGNRRIHTLPPRFIDRVMATRAASICRSVIHAHSSAFNPNSPKAIDDPRHALPAMRPRCCFLYFTFFGIIMAFGPQSLLFLASAFRRLIPGRFGFRRPRRRARLWSWRFVPDFLFPGRLLRRHQRRQNRRYRARRRTRQIGRGHLRRRTSCANRRRPGRRLALGRTIETMLARTPVVTAPTVVPAPPVASLTARFRLGQQPAALGQV